MANTIKVRRSSVPGKIPTTSDILLGELAVNIYDGKLFTKKSTSGSETGAGVTVVEIGSRELSPGEALYLDTTCI